MLALAAAACDGASPAGDDVVPAAAAETYTDGMWVERAKTVRAGLDEALAMHEAGDRGDAAEMVMMVYRGSFEPELEPLVREMVDARVAAELEYRFGLTRDAMTQRRVDAAKAQAQTLTDRLDEAAAQLDAKHAVLR